MRCARLSKFAVPRFRMISVSGRSQGGLLAGSWHECILSLCCFALTPYLSGPIKTLELELISRRVVPVHLNQLRHTPAAVPALEMQHQVDRIRDAAPDSVKGQL